MIAAGRVDANPILAGTAGIAVVITTAFGAHVVSLSVAAMQTIAAIFLRTIGGGFHPANIALMLTAGADMDTVAIAAFLALAAFAVAGVIGAV